MPVLMLTGCQIPSSDVYTFFGGLNLLDYTLNCSYSTNISLNTTNCISPKRAIFVNYNVTWNEVCCSFDVRCYNILNANLSDGCNNMTSLFSYMGPAIGSSSVMTGSICCNSVGACYIDTNALSNCSASDYAMATLNFNLTNTSEWDAICCRDG